MTCLPEGVSEREIQIDQQQRQCLHSFGNCLNHSQSGLKIVQDILKDVEDISFMYLNAEDVVRNRLVGDIVTAYGHWDENISKSTFPIRSGKGDR